MDIFSKVSDYIERDITLSDLESWIVSMLHIYLSNPDSTAAILASRIELGLAEIRAKITTERSFRRILSQHISPATIRTRMYPESLGSDEAISSFSISETMDLSWEDQSPSWSTVPQVEYV